MVRICCGQYISDFWNEGDFQDISRAAIHWCYLQIEWSTYAMLCFFGSWRQWGKSEIVCLWIVQCGDNENIATLLDEFKQHNDGWSLTKCVMSDKDMTERNVIKELFSLANLSISLFHTMPTFKREVSCDKFRDSGWKDTVFRAVDENDLCPKWSKQCIPIIFTEYFDDNWYGIREQWVDGLKHSQYSYLNRTNNRVESINAKFKSIITRYSGITQFFNDLMQCLSSLQVERDHMALDFVTKRRVTSIDPQSALGKYVEVLTPYSFEYVKKQFWNCRKRSK